MSFVDGDERIYAGTDHGIGSDFASHSSFGYDFGCGFDFGCYYVSVGVLSV